MPTAMFRAYWRMGIFDFTDFDVQKMLDDAFTNSFVFHDRTEHKVVGKGEFFDGFMGIFHGDILRC